MYNNDERFAIMFGLLGLFVLTVLSLVEPVVGYILLGLLCLGIISLIAIGIVLWVKTRVKSDGPISAFDELVQLGEMSQQEFEAQLTWIRRG